MVWTLWQTLYFTRSNTSIISQCVCTCADFLGIGTRIYVENDNREFIEIDKRSMFDDVMSVFFFVYMRIVHVYDDMFVDIVCGVVVVVAIVVVVFVVVVVVAVVAADVVILVVVVVVAVAVAVAVVVVGVGCSCCCRCCCCCSCSSSSSSSSCCCCCCCC